jgi:hypothetical protein
MSRKSSKNDIYFNHSLFQNGENIYPSAECHFIVCHLSSAILLSVFLSGDILPNVWAAFQVLLKTFLLFSFIQAKPVFPNPKTVSVQSLH